MLMDIDTLATIQRERHQELLRLVEQHRLVQTWKESDNLPSAKAAAGVKHSATQPTLQEKLSALFQMRIRSILPR